MGIFIYLFPLYDLQVTIGFSFEQNFALKKLIAKDRHVSLWEKKLGI
jgi:hypothetical protein